MGHGPNRIVSYRTPIRVLGKTWKSMTYRAVSLYWIQRVEGSRCRNVQFAYFHAFFKHYSCIFQMIFQTFFKHYSCIFSCIFQTYFTHFSNIFHAFFHAFFKHISNIFHTFYIRDTISSICHTTKRLSCFTLWCTNNGTSLCERVSSSTTPTVECIKR